MDEPRVKARLWVQMALRLSDAGGRPGAVLRSGDPDAGGVLIVLRGREGLSVLSQVRAANGEFDAAGYRNRSGIGRNLTVEVLEYLDRAGHTRYAHGRRRMAP